MIIDNRLNKLHALILKLEQLDQDLQAEIDAALTPEVQSAIALINDKYNIEIDTIAQQIQSEKDIIGTAVLNDKESHRSSKTQNGKKLYCQFMKGKVTWDGKALEGFMIAEPRIRNFRKVGDAYVQFVQR